MRQSRYLNVILTVNALLLGAVLWTQFAGGSGLAQPAMAQAQQQPNPLMQAGEQRVRMVENLDRLTQNITSLQQMLESGRVKVQVTNIRELSGGDQDQKSAAARK
jgi:hypothetical protein